MSTYQELQARGLKTGDIVRAPSHGGQTLAKLRQPYFSYAFVKCADGSQVACKPHLLSKATDDERAAYEAEAKRHEAEWEADV